MRYAFAVDRGDELGRIWRSRPFDTVDAAEAERARVAQSVRDGNEYADSLRVVMLLASPDGNYWMEATRPDAAR